MNSKMILPDVLTPSIYTCTTSYLRWRLSIRSFPLHRWKTSSSSVLPSCRSAFSTHIFLVNTGHSPLSKCFNQRRHRCSNDKRNHEHQTRYDIPHILFSFSLRPHLSTLSYPPHRRRTPSSSVLTSCRSAVSVYSKSAYQNVTSFVS